VTFIATFVALVQWQFSFSDT